MYIYFIYITSMYKYIYNIFPKIHLIWLVFNFYDLSRFHWVPLILRHKSKHHLYFLHVRLKIFRIRNRIMKTDKIFTKKRKTRPKKSREKNKCTLPQGTLHQVSVTVSTVSTLTVIQYCTQ